MYVRMLLQKQLQSREGVDLRLYKVIYQAIEDVEAAMKGMLDPVFEEKVIGHAEVRQIFKASGVGTYCRMLMFWTVCSRETARFVLPEKESRSLKASLHP